MSSNCYWRATIEKSGVTTNRVLLGLKTFTATRQLKPDHPLMYKATKSKIYPNMESKEMTVLEKGRNMEVWRQRNPEFRTNIYPQKLTN
jgi:hypothetical protein